MLPYFPFMSDTYKMTMGVQALVDRSLVEIDQENYSREMALKRALLSTTPHDYFQAQVGTDALQWEVIEVLLPHIARHYPDYFDLHINGRYWTWRNHLLAEETCFTLGDNASLTLAPLDWLGRQVQEDLLVLDGSSGHALPLVAGQLCFPNAWCLDDKLGRAFLEIHDPVPLFNEQIGRSSQLLLERLKVGRPVWRVNWGIKSTSRLNLIPRFFVEVTQANRALSIENIGERCFLRIERQTLSRLPRTHAILFTIHTYQMSLNLLVEESREYTQRVYATLRTTPDDVLEYKGIAPFAPLLLRYLELCLDVEH